MRVSTNLQFYSGTQNLLNNQGALNKLQNQLSTGRKVMTPSDDPVAATRALLVDQSRSLNKQFMNSQDAALTQLGMTDSLMGNVTDSLQSVLGRAVQGGNAANSDAERGMIATDLRQQLYALVDQANTKSASGDYIFGGYRSNGAPFSVSNASSHDGYVSYQGDGGSQRLQVESSMTVGITENGSETFMRVLNKDGSPATQPDIDPLTGLQVIDGSGNPQTKPVSVFDAVKRMIDYLETPTATASKNEYDGALDNLNSALDHISRARASVGARETQLTALKAASDDLDTQYQSTLSGLQDLDYTSAISKFTQQNTQLQAAQQTFMKVTQTNLFSML